jgi:thiamine transporter ThiT
MKLLGTLFGIFAILGMLLGFIPLLGWFNWINIPLAVIGLILSALFGSKTGMTLCIVAIFFGLFRLVIGFGVI